MPALGLGLGVHKQPFIEGGLIDPLAGIPNLMRFSGGSSISLSGFYLDTACTTPITAEWDAVAGIKDIYSDTIVATQSTLAYRPVAILSGDGKWILSFDGIDDFLSTSQILGGQVTYSAVFKSNVTPFNSFWGLFEKTAGNASQRWGFFEQNATTTFPSPAYSSVRRSGVDLVASAGRFEMNPVTEWVAGTFTTSFTLDSTPIARTIGQLESFAFGSFDLHFFFLHVQSPISGDVSVVDAYANTIIPT